MSGGSAHEFSLLLESARAVRWRARAEDLRVTYVGPEAPGLLGYPRSEWLAPGFWERSLHPDDRGTTVAAHRDAAAGPASVFRRDYRMIASDGRAVWVHAVMRVVRGRRGGMGFDGLLLDMTELMHGRQARAPMDELNRAVLASVPGHVAIVDRDGSIIGVNDAWVELPGFGGGSATDRPTGIGENYVVACRAAAAIGDRHAERAASCIDEVLCGRALRASFEYERQVAGAQRWFEMHVEPLRRPDGGAVVAHLDITERRRGELELQRHRHELARVSRAITAGELVGAIAHELRQPLLSIRANTQAALQLLAADEPELTLVRESLADAVADNRRAGEILRSVHDLVTRREPFPEPVDLNHIVRDVLGIVAADASVRSVAVATSLEPDLDPVDGDRVQLQQVVLNLVVNAIDASADARGPRRRFVVETRRLEPGWVELAVADSGPGIAADASMRVFEPFYTTKPDGVGLGLAVVRSITLAHGGRVSAETAPGGGAIFRVDLPAVAHPPR